MDYNEYLIEMKFILLNMENDIRKYGEFQCDWNRAMSEIKEEYQKTKKSVTNEPEGGIK